MYIKKKNILIIPNNTSNNCYGVRNKLPGDYLVKIGNKVKYQNEFKSYYHPKLGRSVLDPGEIDWADVVVFNRHYDVDDATLKNLMEYAKDNGKLVVYETDDLLEGLDWVNPMHQGIQKNVPQVKMMMSLADICTTTGEFLKMEIEKYNQNVFILPNCMKPSDWKLRKDGNKKVKVGWAGGSSHIADLLLVIDVIADLQKELDFDFTIFGLSPLKWDDYIERLIKRNEEEREGKSGQNALWFQKTLELDEKLKGIKWTHQPFVDLKDYNHTLSELNFDIGICPLVDTRFNRCKSAIKFYEYAMVGTTTLASRVSPYREEVSLLAKNKYSNWYNALKELINNKDLRIKEGKAQREWVLKNRDIRSNIHKWEEAYNN